MLLRENGEWPQGMLSMSICLVFFWSSGLASAYQKELSSGVPRYLTAAYDFQRRRSYGARKLKHNFTTHLTATRQSNKQLKSPGTAYWGSPCLTLVSASPVLERAEKQGEETPWLNDIYGSYFRHAPCS